MLGAWHELVRVNAHVSKFRVCFRLVIVFILVGSLIVMNMLVGILVEAVQTVATMEHEQIHVDFAKRVSWVWRKTNVDEDSRRVVAHDG